VGTITYKWYENDIDMGADYNTASITLAAAARGVGTYSYVRKASSASCSEVDSNPFVVQVLAQPDKPTVTPILAAVCYGADVEFTASGSGAGATYSWTGSGAASGTGDGTYTLTTPAVGPTSAVYATASIFYDINSMTKTCVSVTSDAGTATVKPLPEVTAPGTPYVWCGTSNLSAMVVVVTAGGATVTDETPTTIDWYSTSSGGTSLYTGASYTPTTMPTTLTSYYVGAEYDGCTSANLTEVTATGLDEGEISGEEI
jgi:hypothetical protein